MYFTFRRLLALHPAGFLSPAQAAAMLGIHPQSLRFRLRNPEKFGLHRIEDPTKKGKKYGWMIAASEVLRLIEKSEAVKYYQQDRKSVDV